MFKQTRVMMNLSDALFFSIFLSGLANESRTTHFTWEWVTARLWLHSSPVDTEYDECLRHWALSHESVCRMMRKARVSLWTCGFSLLPQSFAAQRFTLRFKADCYIIFVCALLGRYSMRVRSQSLFGVLLWFNRLQKHWGPLQRVSFLFTSTDLGLIHFKCIWETPLKHFIKTNS